MPTSPGPDDGRQRLKTFDRPDPGTAASRAHPWTVALMDSENRHDDFKAAPARIRTALEDFVPRVEWPAVGTSCGLAAWIKGPASSLESNDRACDGPSPGRALRVPRALEAAACVMVLWRDLLLNLLRDNTERLRGALHEQRELGSLRQADVARRRTPAARRP